MRTTSIATRPLGLGVVAAALVLLVAACSPPPGPDPGPSRVDFNSDGALALSINYGTLEDPYVTVTEYSLAATGSWLADEDGGFTADLSFDDATLVSEDSPLGGDVTITTSAAQNGPATGNFDPDTGVGGFTASVTLTLESIDTGSGPEPVGQPCDVEVSLSFTGDINLGNGWLTASDADPVITTMAPDDCGDLGEVLAPAIPGVDQHADIAFVVGTP